MNQYKISVHSDFMVPTNENMEVHHHPDLHHKKKHWKEYILEFLMIFLAVTLGFFAETIREHISENHREKDYIVGLINNVKNDTSELVGLIDRNDLELRGIDTIMKISRTNVANIPVQDSIFFYALQYTISLHLFQFNDLTLVQLRNAGGYSLIKTNKVADSIALYESRNNDIKLQERFLTDYYIQTWNSFKQVFDGTLANKFFHSYQLTKSLPSDINVLISKDEDRIGLLYNNFWTYAIVLNGYVNLLKEHLKYLRQFLTFLKQEYNIE
jgi:hypothetical protein